MPNFLRSMLVILAFATVGVTAIYLTALASGEPWAPAWESGGVNGVVLWAYERVSLVTMFILFLLGLVCAWLSRHGLLAATSLGMFYPIYALLRFMIGAHTGNLLPFEFLGYVVLVCVCLLGYFVGRLIAKRARLRVTGT